MLRVSILTIGDEILIGQIVNTNASWIAQKCVEVGAFVIEHCVVGDSEEEILEALKRLYNLSDIILITGGLGPTRDDLTKPVLTKFFDDELIFSDEVLQWIKEYYSKRGINEVTERNKNLALIPKSCTPLKNLVGTAPGLLFEKENKAVFAMPGVPKEMQFLMKEYVIPYIQNKITSRKLPTHIFRVLQTCGIAESVLADKLSGLEEILNGVNVAFLPSYKGVRLRIEAKGEDVVKTELAIQKVVDFIKGKVGEYIFGEGEVSLAQVVGELLAERKETVAVAESCTGGLLGGEFTNIPGSSRYFLGGIIAYSNEIKERILGVEKQVLQKFGAVSQETATQMSENVRKLFNSTYGISITGIAGPDGGTSEKPVGTVWISLSAPDKSIAKRYQFGDDRQINRERSVGAALTMLYAYLKRLEI
jgi:nicotinamide-nucleotide amidase